MIGVACAVFVLATLAFYAAVTIHKRLQCPCELTKL